MGLRNWPGPYIPLFRSGIPQPQRRSGRPSGAVQAMDAPVGEVCPVPRNLTPSDILLFAVVNSTSRTCMAVIFGYRESRTPIDAVTTGVAGDVPLEFEYAVSLVLLEVRTLFDGADTAHHFASPPSL